MFTYIWPARSTDLEPLDTIQIELVVLYVYHLSISLQTLSKNMKKFIRRFEIWTFLMQRIDYVVTSDHKRWKRGSRSSEYHPCFLFERPSSLYRGPKTGYLTEIFFISLLSSLKMSGNPSIKPRHLPSISLPIYYTLIILSFDDI
jgi:hypothetical protein